MQADSLPAEPQGKPASICRQVFIWMTRPPSLRGVWVPPVPLSAFTPLRFPPLPGGLWMSAELGAVPSACSFCVLTDGGRGHSHTAFVYVVSDHTERVYSLSVCACCRCLKMAVSSPPRIFLFFPYGSLRLRVFSPWPQVSLVSFVPASGWFLTVQMLLRHYTLL